MKYSISCTRPGCGLIGLLEDLITAEQLADMHNRRDGQHRAQVTERTSPASNPPTAPGGEERSGTC